MVTLWAVSIPISGLNVLNKVAVLHILNGTKAPAGSDPQHINALLMLFLDMHRYGIILAQIFWGPLAFSSGNSHFQIRLPAQGYRDLASGRVLRLRGEQPHLRAYAGVRGSRFQRDYVLRRLGRAAADALADQ